MQPSKKDIAWVMKHEKPRKAKAQQMALVMYLLAQTGKGS